MRADLRIVQLLLRTHFPTHDTIFDLRAASGEQSEFLKKSRDHSHWELVRSCPPGTFGPLKLRV